VSLSIDPLTSLAFTLQRGPGQCALLIGSGVSRNSGIPTGWGMTLDLVRRLPGAPPLCDDSTLIAWYRSNFGKEPSYPDIVGASLGAKLSVETFCERISSRPRRSVNEA